MNDINLVPRPLDVHDYDAIEHIQFLENYLGTEEIEHQLDQGLMRAERLRQSILKQAFEGKLVQQDPNDGLTSLLLDKIRAEKAQKGKSKETKNNFKQKQLKIFNEAKDIRDKG
jgi:type I restriction enzyme S subunit